MAAVTPPSDSEEVELEIKPGAAAMGAVALVILSALAISATLGYLLTGAGTKLFSAHAALTTYVPDATGIDPGSEVRLSGIPIGSVTAVRVSGFADTQRIIRIDMKVDSQFLRNIPRDSKAIITEDNLLGDQFVSLDEGTSDTPVTENAVLSGVPVQQAVDRADLIKAMRHELQQADDVVTQLSSPDTQLGALMLGSGQYDQWLARISAFDKSMHTFLSPESRIGQALFSEKLYNDMRAEISGVDKTLDAIQKGEGQAGRMYASEAQYNDLLKRLRDLHKSLADINNGTKGMLRDDAAYRQIRAMLAKTDSLIDTFNKAKLVNDRELYDSLNKTLLKVRAAIGGVSEFNRDPKKHLSYSLRSSTPPASSPK
jgi:hypothetical protein